MHNGRRFTNIAGAFVINVSPVRERSGHVLQKGFRVFVQISHM